MIPTSRSAHRHLLQTVSTSAHPATNVVTKATARTVGAATARTVSTSSSVIRPAVIARNILENNYRASGPIKKPGRTLATGEYNAMQRKPATNSEDRKRNHFECEETIIRQNLDCQPVTKSPPAPFLTLLTKTEVGKLLVG